VIYTHTQNKKKQKKQKTHKLKIYISFMLIILLNEVPAEIFQHMNGD